MAVAVITPTEKMGKCTPMMNAKYKHNKVNGIHTTGDAKVDEDCDGRNKDGFAKQFRLLFNPSDKGCQKYYGVRGRGGGCSESLESKGYIPKSWTLNRDGTETAVYSNDCSELQCESKGKNLTIKSSQLANNPHNVNEWKFKI